MKKNLSRLLSLVLVLVMVLTAIPASAVNMIRDGEGDWWNWWVQPAPIGNITHPEQTLTAELEDGTTVTVIAREGVLPAKTRMTAQAITNIEAVQAAVDQTAGVSGTVLTAVDITFMNGNMEVQPNGSVKVQIASDALAGMDDLSVVHLDVDADELEGDEQAELIDNAQTNSEGVLFSARHFSVYAVIGDGQAGDRARLTVKFHNGNAVIETVYVTKAGVELVDQTVPDPTIVQEEGDTKQFFGWIIDKPNYDSSDVLGDHTINYVRDKIRERLNDTQDPVTEGETMHVYAMFFNYFVVSFVGENGDVVTNSEAVFTLDNEYQYKITEGYTPNNEAQYRFQGWKIVGSSDETLYPNGAVVTISGNTTFRAKVQRGYWLSFNENPDGQHKGAEYRSPVFCVNGEVTSADKPSDPSLAGYTFGDWYKDKNFTQPFSFTGTLSSNTEVYAKWNKNANAPYTVLVWLENLAGDGYDLGDTITVSGAQSDSAISTVVPQGSGKTAYASINGTDYKYDGFAYASNDQSGKTVNPAGTTIVNVYYSRNSYTLTFQAPPMATPSNGSSYVSGSYYIYDNNDLVPATVYSRGGKWYLNEDGYAVLYTGGVYSSNTYSEVKTITARYGEDISGYFPIHGTNGVNYENGERWLPQTPNGMNWHLVMVKIMTMPNTDVTFKLSYPERPLKTMNYYVEYVDGLTGVEESIVTVNSSLYYNNGTLVSSSEYSSKSFYKDFSISARYNGVTAEDMLELPGFEIIGVNDKGESRSNEWYYAWDSENDGTLDLYYKRLQYQIFYQDGIYYDGQDPNTTAPVEDAFDRGVLHSTDPIYYEVDISSYADYTPTCDGFLFEGWYFDKQCTSPATFTTMPDHNVTVYAKWKQIQYRVFLETNGGSFVQSNQASNYRKNWGDMTNEGGAEIAVTWAGHEFLGWYSDKALTEPFNFATRLNESNTTDYPASERVGDTESDADRYWVMGKKVVYAKWRVALPGASGITVKYDAVSHPTNGSVPGTFSSDPDDHEWKDTNYYADGARAIGRTASSPNDPNNYVFLYWEIMNADGTPSGKKVYPGQNYVVEYSDAVQSDPVPSGTKSGAEVGTKAVTDKYKIVTSLQAGKKYLIARNSYFMTNTAYYSDNTVLTSVNITPTLGSDGYYTFSSDMSTYQYTAEASGSYWRFKSSDGYYLANIYDSDYYEYYLGKQTGTFNWTYNNNRIYYSGYYIFLNSNNRFDVTDSTSSSARTLTIYELADAYTVTFQDWDGTVLKTETVLSGGSATPPSDPSRPGYTFTGWSGSYTNVTSNITLTAKYTENSGAVTEEIWKPTDTIELGKEYLIGYIQNGVTYLLMSYNPATGRYYGSSSISGYTADKVCYAIPAIMDDEGVNVTGVNTTNFAGATLEHTQWIFSEGRSTGMYKIQSVYNGSYYLRIESDSSSSSTDLQLYPATPYSSSYGGSWVWENSKLSHNYGGSYLRKYIGVIKNNSTQLPVYFDADSDSAYARTLQLYRKVTTKSYVVNFYGWDDELLSSQTVEEGLSATEPDTSAIPNIPTGYRFKQWSTDDWQEVHTALDVYAEFETTSGEAIYDVTFVNWDGNIIDVQHIVEGHKATQPAASSITAPNGYTFSGWDNYEWDSEEGVHSDLTVNAVFAKNITKVYTVTLRAVYGEKVPVKETHITWYANNGSGLKLDSENVQPNANITIQLPKEAGGDNIFTWADHEFLGWARLDETDINGNTVSHTDAEPLTEADLFLKWDSENNSWLTHSSDNPAEWTDNDWIPVQYVAADEKLAYHGMYAVWGTVIYVYHSADNTVEKVVTTKGNGNTVDGKQFFDITKYVRDDYLYGGYYKNYAGKSTGFEAKNVAANLWTAYTPVAGRDVDTKYVYTDNGTNAKAYITADGAINVTWDWNESYNTDTKDANNNPRTPDANGMSIKPVAGTTYFIKEVPDTMYLQPYLHYTYKLGYGEIKSAWLFSDIDDLNYNDTGFVIVNVKKGLEQTVSVANSVTITTQYGNSSVTLTPSAVFGSKNVSGGWLTYLQVKGGTNGITLEDGQLVKQYWKTPDGLYVTGTTIRSYTGLSSAMKIKKIETIGDSVITLD